MKLEAERAWVTHWVLKGVIYGEWRGFSTTPSAGVEFSLGKIWVKHTFSGAIQKHEGPAQSAHEGGQGGCAWRPVALKLTGAQSLLG